MGQFRHRIDSGPEASRDSLRPPPHEPLLSDLRELEGHKRILVMGGSFDPFTIGHLEAAIVAGQSVEAEMILFLPAKKNPLKPTAPEAPDLDRLEMIRQALMDRPGMYVSPLEFSRNGDSYTAETLSLIRDKISDETTLFLLIGSDCLFGLHRWKNLDRIFELSVPVVIERGGSKEQVISSLKGRIKDKYISSLERNFISRITDREVSSSLVRQSLKDGRVPADLLHPETAAYISKRRLYGP